jgi:hypothetical protein
LEVQAMADDDIWLHINPEHPPPEEGLLVRPQKPLVTQLDWNANAYLNLSTANQNRFDHTRKHFDQDMKYYQKQQDLIRDVRKYITSHVSVQKKLLLDRDLTIQQRLVRLKENTKPTEAYMANKAHTYYIKALKGLGKTTKVGQWVDRWEHAMKLIEKYNLPQVATRLWLRDISQAIKPLSDALCINYGSQANDVVQNKLSEYRAIA